MFKCEVSARKVLPIIRKELAVAMKARGKKTGEIAKLLDTTPAAISQYISGKRGHFSLSKSELKKICKIADKSKIKQKEICELCKEITNRIKV